MATDYEYDLCVVGSGSGGIGASLAAARMGLKVVLVEREESIGGNAARGGVSSWEPGVGGTGFPFEIYRRLLQRPQSTWIAKNGRHCSITPSAKRRYPGGELVEDPSGEYKQTLRRSANPPLDRQSLFGPDGLWRRVVFEPLEYAIVIDHMIRECESTEIFTRAEVVSAETFGQSISSVTLGDGRQLKARYFIDATESAKLCEFAGCELLIGRDTRKAFDEPDAPEISSNEMNGVTLIYRVQPSSSPIASLPLAVDCWWAEQYPMAVFTQMPAGGLKVNMLPTMEGEEFLSLGYQDARTECERRVQAHWQWLQSQSEEFANLEIDWIAPSLGVREGPRIRARRMLTQHDILRGISRQNPDEIIALADHAMDRHGSGGGCRELLEPYGIPFDCLLPVGLNNVAIASRAAGFSSIAASSCRLSRTMMDLGHAAGAAAALATSIQCELPNVPVTKLRETLQEQHAWIDWPMPDSINEHLHIKNQNK